MDLAFTDEQEHLRASVREVMADKYPIERVAAISDGAGFDRDEWAIAARAGWTDMSVPEDEGGAGLGFVEEAIVAEELGRALYPGPFLASVVTALPLLRASASSAQEAAAVARGELIATVAFADHEALERADTVLSGTALFVPNLDVADLVIVTDLERAWQVDTNAGGVSRETLPAVDASRAIGELRLDGASATELGTDAVELAHARDRVLAALAAEACGVAERVLEMAVAFARERRQFGRPIGSFQGVSHELARAYMDVETSRSLTYWAAWTVQERTPDAPAAAAAAKARAAEGAILACERAIQAHGGVGFTWEHPLHRFYKRALAAAATMETADALWSRVAGEVVGARGGPAVGSAG